ncbi:MAG: hypothetical protein JWO84_378 [Parcubacteria group bacterium]|nr:hypothetical protein [Parcubacteria group bacterium]
MGRMYSSWSGHFQLAGCVHLAPSSILPIGLASTSPKLLLNPASQPKVKRFLPRSFLGCPVSTSFHAAAQKRGLNGESPRLWTARQVRSAASLAAQQDRSEERVLRRAADRRSGRVAACAAAAQVGAGAEGLGHHGILQGNQVRRPHGISFSAGTWLRYHQWYRLSIGQKSVEIIRNTPNLAEGGVARERGLQGTTEPRSLGPSRPAAASGR